MGLPDPLPDPQRVYLDALREYAADHLDGDHLDELIHDEPESHVFTASDLDEAFAGDYDEARNVVLEVGSRDLDAKIRYWEHILRK